MYKHLQTLEGLRSKFLDGPSHLDSSSLFNADGFGGLGANGWLEMPKFAVAPVDNPDAWIKMQTSEKAAKSLKLHKGTTTLSFKTKDGIFVAADSRASGGSYIASQTVRKIIVITKYILGTMAGGAADCAFWERELSRQARIYELSNGEMMSIAAASKLLSNILYYYRGMGICVGTMISGKDKTGYRIFYVDDDGNRLEGNLFSVGSGSTHAYGILDSEYDYDMPMEAAVELARRSIFHATHRDAASGGYVSVYHIGDNGWRFLGLEDVTEIYYKTINEAR